MLPNWDLLVEEAVPVFRALLGPNPSNFAVFNGPHLRLFRWVVPFSDSAMKAYQKTLLQTLRLKVRRRQGMDARHDTWPLQH